MPLLKSVSKSLGLLRLTAASSAIDAGVNEVYSRDNLPKTIKNGAYVLNLDEYSDVGTHWIAL